MPAIVEPLVGETLREGLRELLSSHRNAHTAWRYLYEDPIDKKFETAALHQTLTVIIDAYGKR